MFDKVSEAAERLAVHVSRRDFFGWAGKSALALAGIVGGILAFPADARAGGLKNCCKYYTLDGACGFVRCVAAGTPCPPAGICFGVPSLVHDCGQCK